MPNGMMWVGPAGTFTSLHHDLTNNFIAQVVGRKQIKLLPAGEVGRLYNREHVFSEISDLDAQNIDAARHPRLAGTRTYDLVIEPGEILFVPLAWWHQVRSLDFSVTVTYTNFRWPNEGYATYPGG
jgi:ribosomal protein L16 Arg81 hydroxylase